MENHVSTNRLKTAMLAIVVGVASGWWRLSPSLDRQAQAQVITADFSFTRKHLSHDMDTLLSTTQVQAELSTLPGWQFTGKAIYKTFQFDNFVDAIAFVNQLVEPAETNGHHPDLKISYNRVVVTLTTHDAGGLTTKDITLARAIAQIYVDFVSES